LDLQTRRQYLGLMGIPLWVPRIQSQSDQVDQAADAPQPAPDVSAPASTAVSAERSEGHDTAAAAVAVQPARGAAAALRTLDVPDTADTPRPRPAAGSAQTGTPVTRIDCTHMDWQALQQAVTDCNACGLHRTRTRTVFGTGHQQADWMIIGEAPGAEEDRQGEPFVGRAGKLLDNMLKAIDLDRNKAYITNTLKCRPPNNRDPKPDESESCRGYLERQLALIQPRLILVVGRIAAHNLLQTNVPLGRLRGSLHQVPGTDIPVLVTYHPAYLLRRPTEKRKAWQDLQQAMAFARQHGF